MDFAQFYRLREPHDARFVRGSPEVPTGSFHVDLTFGTVRPKEPVVVRRTEGHELADIVYTDGAPILVSSRLVAALRSTGLTGWSTYPTHLLGVADPMSAGYLGLAIIGRCGRADYSRSEIVHRDDVPGRFRRRLYFDPESWDGSDFFLPEGTLNIVLTERARQLLEQTGIKNYSCERLIDVTTSDLVIRFSGEHIIKPADLQ